MAFELAVIDRRRSESTERGGRARARNPEEYSSRRDRFESLLGVLLVAVLLAAAARRVGAPYPGFLAIGGALLAFSPGAPRFTIEPEVALGARGLFGDSELVAVKGLLTVRLPQAGVDYAVATDELSMFPRSDGIVLGGTPEPGVETLEPDLEAEKRILAGQRAIFEGMRSVRAE